MQANKKTKLNKVFNYIKENSNDTYYASFSDIANYCDSECNEEIYIEALELFKKELLKK